MRAGLDDSALIESSWRLNLQQVLSECDGDGFGSGGGAEAGEAAAEMGLDAVGADTDQLGDLAVVESLGDITQHFELAGLEFGFLRCGG